MIMSICSTLPLSVFTIQAWEIMFGAIENKEYSLLIILIVKNSYSAMLRH